LTQFALSTDRPILVLCPGAEFGPAKRWPEPHYAKVANHYLALGWQVWILGSAKDKAVAHQIQNLSNDRCIDLSGCTSLAQVIDLMSLATVVVSNDSGLMHIAAALSRPLVALYGSSSADFTPPLSAQVQVLREKLACSPCFKRHCPLKHHACMQNLQPERIIEGVQELLA
jgi:heptosyltransferase-2